MNQSRYFIFVCFLILLLPTTSVFGQSEADTVSSLPNVEIRTSVDKADMHIGDLITYRLTIIYDSTYELIPPPLGANLGAFDVKDYKQDIVKVLKDGRMQSDNVFILSTFTVGDYIIPPIPVAFDLPDSTRKVIVSEAVHIKVKSLLQGTDDSLDIKPLKAQHEFLRDLTKYYLWGGLAVLVLLAAGLFIWRRRKKRKGEGEPEDLRPPWEIAFERLAVLQEKNLIDTDSFKLYYIELSEITRWYLGRVYQRNVLDMTTDEFMAQFEDVMLPLGIYDNSLEFLRFADLVKFAKLEPERERFTSDFERIHALVEKVRSDQMQRQVVKATDDNTHSKKEEILPPSGGTS